MTQNGTEQLPADHPELFFDSKAGDPIALSLQISSALADKRRFLRYPARLEQLYQQESFASRTRQLMIGILVGLLIYDLFLFVDFLLLPDIINTAQLVRLFIITPAALLTLWLIHHGLNSKYREFLVALVSLGASFSLIFLFTYTQFPDSIYFHFSLMLIVSYSNIVVRLRFHYAVLVSMISMGAYWLAIPWYPDPSTTFTSTCLIIMLANALFTLFANFSMEQEQRRSYLISLRDRLSRSQLAQHNLELSRISSMDSLTGLANRRALDSFLAARQGDPNQRRLALIMLDVDYFKAYNDHYGHQAGDRCLIKVANALKACLRRNTDLLARFGGEEFVAVLPGASLKTATTVAEQMRLAVERQAVTHEYSPGGKQVTISAGVASGPNQLKMSDLLSQADEALYQAKAGGRNQVRARLAAQHS